MFGLLGSIGTYESRKVANTKIGGAIIDTAAVTDSAQPFETGIMHPQYRNGYWVVVELYPSKKAAELGHAKWVKAFSGKQLPPRLVDVNESQFGDFVEALGHSVRGVFKRIVPKR